MTKYLVITGGSRGIGEETIRTFIENGWSAINLSRSPCSIGEVKNFSIDLANSQSIQQYSNELRASVATAETICLVHNAAVYLKDSVIDICCENLRTVLEVNLVAAVALNKIFLPTMHAGSAIIYIGSTLSEKAIAERASYVISKHALIGLMRATCQDLAGKNIITCCICPGFVNTAMATKEVNSATLNEIIKQKVIASRLIEPEEIAKFIYFCATHPIINGAVLHANLGQIEH